MRSLYESVSVSVRLANAQRARDEARVAGFPGFERYHRAVIACLKGRDVHDDLDIDGLEPGVRPAPRRIAPVKRGPDYRKIGGQRDAPPKQPAPSRTASNA